MRRSVPRFAAGPAHRRGVDYRTVHEERTAAESDLQRSLPKLVLQITIDRLRGELPLRYGDRFAVGGFRYLLERGTWDSAAHHPHSYTETIVGNTMLATGAYPSRHGMVANNWYDRASQ